uniref:Putative iron-containing alcohol dehydrogenase n=1 Tax=uncultured marine microorganism HF4000_ANIW141K23 TaxID=455538 RepID=B3T5N9_9ZZZZ|nr:putative iron-containing alcohol dehydrogenase [uncultured marine microorganism HF4000_ANIW141K23]
MWKITQPDSIHFDTGSAHEYHYPPNSLIITSKGAISRGWIDYMKIKNFTIFDEVKSNPSFETVENIISQFKDENFSHIIGLGGGSSLDVAKFVAFKMEKKKIMIPTTFGTGSEVTGISVLNVDGKKTSFHDNKILADVAIVDPNFIEGTPMEVIKNSAIDACAQCSEAYDSKLSNPYTKFLCETAFDILENAILNDKFEKLSLGSLICGLGFGNSSTTLGHALSYVFSNEGIAHGHALAYTTTMAHKFNNSQFYERFLKVVKNLNFPNIKLKQNLEKASLIIFKDRKHLDNNPKSVTKNDIIGLLEVINSQNACKNKK